MKEESFLKLIKDHFSPVDYSMWLRQLRLSPKSLKSSESSKALTDGCLHLVCSSGTKKDKIERDFLSELTSLLCSYDPKIRKVVIDLQESSEHQDISNASTAEFSEIFDSEIAPARDSRSNFSKNGSPSPNDDGSQNGQTGHLKQDSNIFDKSKTFSFSNFVQTTENALALSFAKKVVSQFSRISLLYFYGPVGVGKTHLLYAIKEELSKVIPHNRMRFITPDLFVGEFSNALRSRRDAEFRARYHALDLLIIDDIQLFMGKEKTSIEFFHVFNSIYCPGKQMIFASDRSPSELGGIDNRLKSRLSSSAVVSIDQASYPSRKKILDFYIKQSELTVDEEVFDFIAQNISGDIRKIIGVVRTLSAIFDVEKRKINLDDCQRVLKALSVYEKVSVRAEDVLLAVEKYFAIKPTHWQADRKDHHFKQAFHIAVYLLKKHCQLNISQIASLIYCKPYSIVYSLKVMNEKLISEKKINTAILEIEKSFIELD